MDWADRVADAYEDCRRYARALRERLVAEARSATGDQARLNELAGERARLEAEILRHQQLVDERNGVLARRYVAPKQNHEVAFWLPVAAFHLTAFTLTLAMIVASYFLGSLSDDPTRLPVASDGLTLRFALAIAAGATVVAWGLGYLFSTLYRTRNNVMVLSIALAILLALGGGASAADIIAGIPRLSTLIVLNVTSVERLEPSLTVEQAVGLAAYVVAFLTGTVIWRLPSARIYRIAMDLLSYWRPDRELAAHRRALDVAYGTLFETVNEQAKLLSKTRHTTGQLTLEYRHACEGRAEILYSDLLRYGRKLGLPDGERRARAARKQLIAHCIEDLERFGLAPA